jgi:hypothetical protein
MPPPEAGWFWPHLANPEGGIMPITDTVDMLTASGGTAALTGIIAVVGGVLSAFLSKQVVALIQHVIDVIDVIDDRTLAKDPERARIVAELRRARRGQQ